ncbi:MAG: cohesin domain-containing protein [Bacillota bacterium]|nr:cohesin domain-containing protein [Bacillota bacterium]
MKKLMIFMLILMLLCGFCGTVYAENTIDTTITIGNVYGEAGKVVSVPVYVQSTGPLMAIVLKVRFDENSLEYIPYQSSSDKGNLGFSLVTSGITLNDSDVIGITLSSSSKDVNANGVLLYLRFNIKEGTSNGIKALEVTFASAANMAGTAANITTTAGGITIDKRIKGDVDGDGKIGTFDGICILKYLSGTMTLEGSAQSAADCDGNGTVEITDAVTLLKYVARIINTLN